MSIHNYKTVVLGANTKLHIWIKWLDTLISLFLEQILCLNVIHNYANDNSMCFVKQIWSDELGKPGSPPLTLKARYGSSTWENHTQSKWYFVKINISVPESYSYYGNNLVFHDKQILSDLADLSDLLILKTRMTP